MRILVIGGTAFLGRHFVETALARGHELTLFNRGQRNPQLFPAVERIQGDRTQNLDRLAGRRWDAVLDTCGYLPRVVGLSAQALAEATDHYTFVSSVSVYRDYRIAGIDEAYPVGELERPTETIDERTYGPLKALCEQTVEAALPDRALVVRPGLIVGPHDPTQRFTYWPVRVERGGEILAPQPSGGPVQFTDVRDLAEWMLRLIEARITGCYNATGPEPPISMEQLLRICQAVSGSESHITWVEESFLLDQGVRPWTEVPLWIPLAPDDVGANRVSARRALERGLTFRPVDVTVRDTLEWARTLTPAPGDRKAGLDPEREAELLRLWRAQEPA